MAIEDLNSSMMAYSFPFDEFNDALTLVICSLSSPDFGAIKVKLAEMATSAYAGESATYRAAKNIEDRIATFKTVMQTDQIRFSSAIAKMMKK